MPSKRHYDIAVSNSYLGKSRVIRGTNKKEVQFLADEQLKAWRLEEAHKRQHEYQRALQTQAQLQQQQARAQAQWQQQQAQWQKQEEKRQEQHQLLELSTQAERSDKEAQVRQIPLRELLQRGLGIGKRFDWNVFKNSAPYPPFQFTEPAPS